MAIRGPRIGQEELEKRRIVKVPGRGSAAEAQIL